MSDNPFPRPVEQYDRPLKMHHVPAYSQEDALVGQPDPLHWLVATITLAQVLVALDYLIQHLRLVCTGGIAAKLEHHWEGTEYIQYSLIGWLVKDIPTVQQEERVDALECPHNHYWGAGEGTDGRVVSPSIWSVIHLSHALANFAYGMQRQAQVPLEEVAAANAYLLRLRYHLMNRTGAIELYAMAPLAQTSGDLATLWDGSENEE